MADIARRLARWRVPLGYIIGIIAFWLADPTPDSLVAGMAIASIGEALRIWAAGHLEKGREVTRTGPYAFTRHPLYVGSALMGAGFIVAARSSVVAGIVFVYFAVTVTAAVLSEEAHLVDKFGETYPAYRAGRSTGAQRRFSLERAMRNREYRAVVGFVAVLALLAARLAL